MGTTNIVKFAGDTQAQVQSDAGYTAQNGPATVGFVDGPADPTQVNKALRQSSAVAAAVARLATDPAQGNQPTFNDGEDAATLATKLLTAINNIANTNELKTSRDLFTRLYSTLQLLVTTPSLGGQPQFDLSIQSSSELKDILASAIANLPPTKLNNIVADLFKRLLANAGLNPGEADKFTDDKLLSYTSAQLDDLVLSSLYKTVMTRKGILERPPVSDWRYLDAPLLPLYSDAMGYVRQAEFRVLANGAIEIRVAFMKGFSPKDSLSAFVIGRIPNRYSPCAIEKKPIYGSIFKNKDVAANPAPYSDMSLAVYPTQLGYIEAYPNRSDVEVWITYTNPMVAQSEPWIMVYGASGPNPFGLRSGNSDPNVYEGTVTSLMYMPKFPYPYAYYKLDPYP